GVGGAVEPWGEALEVDRDGELEAVQYVRKDQRRCGSLGSALDRRAGGVAGLERKRVRGPRDQEGDRGAPGCAHRGADERADVRARADVRIQARVEPPGECRGSFTQLAKAPRDAACGAVHGEGSGSPCDTVL